MPLYQFGIQQDLERSDVLTVVASVLVSADNYDKMLVWLDRMSIQCSAHCRMPLSFYLQPNKELPYYVKNLLMFAKVSGSELSLPQHSSIITL